MPSKFSLRRVPPRGPVSQARPSPGAGVLRLWLGVLAISAGTLAADLTWETRPGVRLAALHPVAPGRTGFAEIAGPSVGVGFTNVLADERSVANRNLLSGAGVAAGDFDGDGWCDVYFCGLDSDNRLFRNLGGWRFEDVTQAAGVACAGQDSTGATFADVDGDGDLDLLVSSLGKGLRIFRNEGGTRFREVTQESGVASRTGGMSMALADIDGDGDLDLYVANYFPTTIRDRPTTRFEIQTVDGKPRVMSVAGRPTTEPDLTNRFELGPTGEIVEHSEQSDLFLNDGRGGFTRASFTDGRFVDQTGAALKQAPRDWSLSVRFYDFTGDGAPDLYVCNDLFSPDGIWVNDGRGRFRALPNTAVRHTSSFSMGMDFGDLDRDGRVDFYVVDMVSRDLRNRKVQIAGLSPYFATPGVFNDRPQFFQNTLFWGRGDATFAEGALQAGLEATEWSWQPVFLDVDLDGFEDILVPNGMLRDFQNADMGQRIETAVTSRQVPVGELVKMFGDFPGLMTTNLAFRNRHNRTFEEVGAAWGFNTAGISQGMALADFDNDGDLDVVINNLNHAATLYRNESAAPRLLVRLRGRAPNTAGIGARLRVLGGPVDQTQEIVAGGRYLSGDAAVRSFAAGSAKALTVEVTWRDGRRSRIQEVPPNSLCEVDEATAEAVAPAPVPPVPPPLFEDVSRRVPFAHHEAPYNDFARQFFLPRVLSLLGPGVAWVDLEGDGDDDLLVASGQGGRVGVFRNDGQGGFQSDDALPWSAPLVRDLTALIGLPTPQGAEVLAGSSNYEDGQEAGPMVLRYRAGSPQTSGAFPGQQSSTGPLCAADVDGDGDLDLFVGGRVIPGRYPEPASSFLFLNQDGAYRVDARNLQRFAHVGMVSGAVFSDLDGDGDPDLILACEWGPLRIFQNDRGLFAEVTDAWGFSAFKGWWSGVTTVDLDEDGRLDIVAANWGLNSRYRTNAEHPIRIYYGDFAESGVLDLIEARLDPPLGYYVPERDLRVMSMGLPFLRDQFKDHQGYASASVEQMLGSLFSKARFLEATALPSMAFLNRGSRWEARELPSEAQQAPAFGVVAADFDGDGHDDVFLSQNFFGNEPFTGRYDAGRGLLLKGDGRGGLQAVPGTESGIIIHGEQRGAAVADFDSDGRPDLVVTQNSAPIRLFHNTQGRPGLRVRLQGAAGNPHGIGVSLRLQTGDAAGPAREVRAGSGYWSQDSTTLVCSGPRPATAIRVRWPGAAEQLIPLPEGAREVRISRAGSVQRMH